MILKKYAEVVHYDVALYTRHLYLLFICEYVFINLCGI